MQTLTHTITRATFDEMLDFYLDFIIHIHDHSLFGHDKMIHGYFFPVA